MRVLVIGANGFVGRAVTKALRAEEIYDVLAGVRSDKKNAQNIRCVDACDLDSVMAALQGVTHVVNAVMGSAETMVTATRIISEAALKKGVQRVVHFSSCAVYGDTMGRVDEKTPYGAQLNAYALAKVASEAIVQDYVKRGFFSIILRPSCIYGPESHQWTGRVGRLLKAFRLGDMAAEGDGRCNLVYIDDVAAAVVASLVQPLESGTALNLSITNPPTWNEYLMRYAQLLDAVPLRRIPSWQLKLERKLLAPAFKIAQIFLQKAKLPLTFIPDPLTPSFLNNLRADVVYDGRKAEQLLALSWTPWAEGLKSSAQWFNGQK